jgi:Flp pilus assembly protein TadD
MSLLNDALRKEIGERKSTGHNTTVLLKSMDRRRLLKKWILPIGIAGSLIMLAVTGTWYWLTAVEATPRQNPQALAQAAVISNSSVESQSSQQKDGVMKPAAKEMPIHEPLVSPPKKDPVILAAKESKPTPRTPPKQLKQPKRQPAIIEQKDPSDTKKVSETGQSVDKSNQTSPSKTAPKTSPNRVKRHKQSISSLFRKAELYQRQNQLDRAIAMYRQVLKLDPDHFDSLLNLSSAYIQTEAFDKAQIIAADLHVRAPENHFVTVNLAIAKIGMGDPAEAIRLLDKTVDQIDAPQFEIYFHKGVAFRQLGRTRDAITFYKKAEQLNPDAPALLFNLAVAFDNRLQYAEALHYYRKCTHQLKKDGRGAGLPVLKIEERIRTLLAELSLQQLEKDS